jgi:GNAT superfamily N-acetyltransferase
MQAPPTDLTIRRAAPDELDELIGLARLALGWDDRHEQAELFRWKHLENPFGVSPAWVAVDAGTLVGFRTFLRWRWSRPGDAPLDAVRAVDTATHPDHQGRGIFTRLTLAALPELADEGVQFVFNTPNAQSRPGYLKMGWHQLGRVPIAVHPRSPRDLMGMIRARKPASKWSEPTTVGVDASEFFADGEAVARLLSVQPLRAGMTTLRSPEFLQWRYGLDALHYRCLPVGDRVEDGAIVFRVRTRGTALEVTVCDALVPSPHRSLIHRMLRELTTRTGATYAIGTPASCPFPAAVPVPGQGPLLTWRELRDQPSPTLADFDLTLGDIELF